MALRARRDLDATRQVAAIGSGSYTISVRWSGCAQLRIFPWPVYKLQTRYRNCRCIHYSHLGTNYMPWIKLRFFKTINKISTVCWVTTTSFSGNRLVISHTMEVSTLGLASDNKDFTSTTKLPDVSNSLWHSVACQALSSSIGIYCTRNSSDYLTNPRIYKMSSV